MFKYFKLIFSNGIFQETLRLVLFEEAQINPLFFVKKRCSLESPALFIYIRLICLDDNTVFASNTKYVTIQSKVRKCKLETCRKLYNIEQYLHVALI